jgi:hypothetical protein
MIAHKVTKLLKLLPTDWRYVFVADFGALSCQVTRKFIRCRNAENRTISAIKYTACYALAVLVCLLVSIKLHFHIKLVIRFTFFSCVACVLACFNFFFKEMEKNFEILLLGWKGESSFASFALCLGFPKGRDRSCGLQMCLRLCVGYILIYNSSFSKY